MPVLVSLALDKGLDLLGTAVGQGLLVVLLIAAAAITWLWSRRPADAVPPRVRQFTLLRTENSDGSPVQYETTLPTGTTITPWVNGHQRRYTLTDGQLADNSFAAEPLDHL
ncbi:hypothetical protein [Streptomyces ortus]|uniref:Uncharacterized protein n=1 Tax=Streptomyces ortus TaxID=2867268 RepID=A0ABT3V0G9_9ACTN|nr:hypothetical protein [Streptomyces ortus]MCX4231793.1 hypothetical protein [Streptomyces ortus]